jgi:hypothetical protein
VQRRQAIVEHLTFGESPTSFPVYKSVPNIGKSEGLTARSHLIAVSTTDLWKHGFCAPNLNLAMDQHQPNYLEICSIKIPTGILSDIFVLLRPSDLMSLSFVNRNFSLLTKKYHARCNSGLNTMPNEIILEIIQHLGAPDQSRLARASRRIYPLIMDAILRDDSRHGKSRILWFAVEKNLKSLTRRVLQRGGEVSAVAVVLSRFPTAQKTPLLVAAHRGFEGIVNLLLKFGAHHSANGQMSPIKMAIFKRHEKIALILYRALESNDVDFNTKKNKLLRMACAAKLVKLVRYLLERRVHLNIESEEEVDTALYCVLQVDICQDKFLKRALHEDVYQIVLMLLQHGARPHVQPKGRILPPYATARALSSRHPDPRVRALLLEATPEENHRETRLQVGRPWLSSQEAEAASEDLRLTDSHLDYPSQASLGDFLTKSNGEQLPVSNEDDLAVDQDMDERNIHGEHSASVTFDIDTLLDEKAKQDTDDNPETSESCLQDDFPQLGNSHKLAQHTAQDLWTNVNPSVRSSYTPRTYSTSTNSRKLEVPTQTDQFPPLSKRGQSFGNVGKGKWEGAREDGVFQSTRDVEQIRSTSTSKEKRGIDPSSQKRTKSKKKWVPLLI